MDDMVLLSDDFTDGTGDAVTPELELPVSDDGAVEFPVGDSGDSLVDTLPPENIEGTTSLDAVNADLSNPEPTLTLVPEDEPTVTPVPVTPIPTTEYDLDDIYNTLVQIDAKQTDAVAIGRQQVSLMILQLAFVCVIAGLFLARIVWRKI